MSFFASRGPLDRPSGGLGWRAPRDAISRLKTTNRDGGFYQPAWNYEVTMGFLWLDVQCFVDHGGFATKMEFDGFCMNLWPSFPQEWQHNAKTSVLIHPCELMPALDLPGNIPAFACHQTHTHGNSVFWSFGLGQGCRFFQVGIEWQAPTSELLFCHGFVWFWLIYYEDMFVLNEEV